MRTINVHTLAAAALALLTVAGSASSQTPASQILNALEVQKLASSTDPADNARLGSHFAALADRYAAEAKRHTSMAQAFIGTPARRVAATSAADHCKRLAQLNTESAKTLRELAAYHQGLAGGKPPAAAPKGGTRFQSGAGAPEPTDAQLADLAAKANTPADHHALEEYFQNSVKRYTAAANEHAAMAQAYRGTRIVQAAAHCDRLVTLSRDSVKEATAAAEMHKGLAGIAR